MVTSTSTSKSTPYPHHPHPRLRLLFQACVIIYIFIYSLTYGFQLVRMLVGITISRYRYPVLQYAHGARSADTDPASNAKSSSTVIPTTASLISTTIPAIMHHIAISEEIPEIWQYSYESCVFDIHHRDIFKFHLWTDTTARNFIADNYPDFLKVYDSYPYTIQRVDAVRYYLLYHYGGIYLDMDVGCRTQVDFLRFQSIKALFPITSPIGVSNDVMISIPKHPFMKFLIDQLPRYQSHWLFKYPTVMFSTGSGFLSYMLYLYSFTAEGSVSRAPNGNKDIALIDNFAYTQVNFFHVEGSSWHGWDARLITVSSVLISVSQPMSKACFNTVHLELPSCYRYLHRTSGSESMLSESRTLSC
jgi:mannosyltransferase OCH1-like enzyme